MGKTLYISFLSIEGGTIMKTILTQLLLGIAVFSLCSGAFGNRQLKLIPNPREAQFSKGEIPLSKAWKICVKSGNPDDKYAAQLLSEEAASCFKWNWDIVDVCPEENYILLEKYAPKQKDPRLFVEQGYTLDIKPEKIIIQGASATGRFYGVQTFRQILRNAHEKAIPIVKIKDYPALEWRGISDDISRGQVSNLEDFKNIIRKLAFYKKNLYQPYIEDMFSFDINPKIGKDRGAVTKEEMAEMVKEAKRNHVVLTPVFECLGHQDRLLSLPNTRKYAEIQDPAKRPWSFSPVSAKTFTFVSELIDEITESTDSPFFHIGGDESFDVGKGESRQKVEELGIGRVHAAYFSRLNDYIKKNHKRKMMLYADMLLRHPEAMEFMPKDCILVDWRYSKDDKFDSVNTLKKAGFKNIVTSPGIWSWATYYPNFSWAFQNISHATQAAKTNKLMGCITSSWGDSGAENLRTNNWLGFGFSAAAQWEEKTPDHDKFIRRFAAVHFGHDSEELARALKSMGWFDYLDYHYLGKIFHRTARIKIQEQAWLEKLDKLEKETVKAMELFARHRNNIRFHKKSLDLIDHAARRNLYIVKRDRSMNKIAQLLGDKKSGALPPTVQKEIVGILTDLRNELSKISGEYPALWLRSNKYPMLEFNKERLQNHKERLQGFILQALKGELTAQKQPWGVWFWYPDEKPTRKADKGNCYFARKLNLSQKPQKVMARLWADDKASLFVNGKELVRVKYNDTPKSLDITEPFQKGDNLLALEASNSYGSAGIIMEITATYPDNTVFKFTGDEQWLATRKKLPEWNTAAPSGENWKKVKLLGSGLIKPWEFLDW